MQQSNSRSPDKNIQTPQSDPQDNDDNVIHTPSLGKLELNTRELEEINLISQGGYAYIFKVKDVNTEEKFALKKMICQSSERLKTAKNEISILQSLPDNPHILKLIDSKIIKSQGGYHAYILLELCEDGSLFDLIVKHQETKLDENQILTIMTEVCDGIKALHSCSPPIAHRDIKIENILLHNQVFKLCDFGSCSTKVVDFAKIPQSEYVQYEEEYQKNTTLMYRPPEMCDPYQRYTVDTKVDIWMLGCILYTLCFFKHPFQGTSKLSIINAAFKFPKDHSYPEKLIDIIRLMLTPDPQYRPSIVEIVDIFKNYHSLTSIKLNSEAQRIKDEAQKNAEEQESSSSNQGDIPIEELMKLQMKVQQSSKGKNKNKSDAPVFKNWADVKYPQLHSTKSVPNTSNDVWGTFGAPEKAPSQSGQQANFGFDSFDQFSNTQKATQPSAEGSQFANFDFASFETKPAQSNDSNNNTWDTTSWGAPQTASSDKNTQAKKDEKNSFDSFANF